MNIKTIYLIVFLTTSLNLISDDFLFKKQLDNNKFVIVKSKPLETNTVDSGSISVVSLAQCLLISLPNTTNVLWKHKYISNINPMHLIYPEGSAKYEPIKIFDIYVNYSDGSFGILWAEYLLDVFCEVGKFPPYPSIISHTEKKEKTALCCVLKPQKESFFSYLADKGNIIYDVKSGIFKAAITMTNGKVYEFERKDNSWIEVK